jgi:hypothetical protein
MSAARPRSLVLGLTVAALLLGLLALSASALGFTERADAANRLTMLVNLLTGVAGVGGAIGFALNKRWGFNLFALSTLGHIIAHTQLYISAIASGRSNLILLLGLALVPMTAISILAAMGWEQRQAGRQARSRV